MAENLEGEIKELPALVYFVGYSSSLRVWHTFGFAIRYCIFAFSFIYL